MSATRTILPTTERTGGVLRAGPLGLLLRDGELRYLRAGGVEVVRRVYAGVRDAAWGTVEPVITNVVTSADAEGFEARFDGRHERGEIEFDWRGRVVGRWRSGADGPEGSVRFEMSGVAGRTFRTCRTGICVLHPLRNVAGQFCTVTHSDGSTENKPFPLNVAPHQPFTEIVAMSQDFPGGLRVEIAFAGDEFETEDQRNWADGSFKTYCRPLARPFPYVLERGQRVTQSVTVTVRSVAESAAREDVLLLSDTSVGSMPPVGLQLSRQLLATEREALRALHPAHLRVDVNLADGQWRERFAELARTAAEAGAAVELAVRAFEGDDAALMELGRVAGEAGVPVCRWLVYEPRRPVPSAEVLRAARRHLQGAPVGPGTVGSFAEVNRRPPDRTDVVAFGVSPQVHGTDDLTIVESLESLTDIVRTARALAPGAAVSVGPVSLHRRPDPFAAGKSGEEEAATPDPRQKTMFGAAWTLGCLAALARGGADSITLYEVGGPLGTMAGAGVFPLYHVLADVGEFAGADVMEFAGLDPIPGAVLALRAQWRLRLMLASFDEPLRMAAAGLGPFLVGSVVRLDQRGIERHDHPPDGWPERLELEPFTYLRLDLEPKGGPLG